MHARNFTLGVALSAMVLVGAANVSAQDAATGRFGTWIIGVGHGIYEQSAT